jgi:conjugal transfer/entry exclusion protein
MKRMVLAVVLLCLCAVPAVQAQGLPVFDAANALQNTIQAVQAVLMVGNQLLELAGLDGIEANEDFASEMEEVGRLVTEARGLGQDLASLQFQVALLFDLDTAPNGSSALRERLAAIRRVTFEAYVDALRTQTLVRTTLSAVRHLTNLVAGIESLLGNMQSNQQLLQIEATLTKKLTEMQVQTAAYQRAQSLEHLQDPLAVESVSRINDALMEDYPQ